MDDPAPNPLTVAEAKTRLLQAAEHIDPIARMRRRPLTLLLSALALGMLAARLPAARLTPWLAHPLLWRALLRRLLDSG